MRRRRGLAIAVAVLTASAAFAQLGRPRDVERVFGRPAAFANPGDFDGGFQFCRLVFRESPNGDGAGWNVDWPRADLNLSIRLAELTRTPVSLEDGEPKTLLVNPMAPELDRCPFVMMSEPGAAFFTPEEAAHLRDYLQRGGFLWADDFWGDFAWEWWERELRGVRPAGRYPIVDLTIDNPIFHQMLGVPSLLQIPGIGYWDGADRTSERGALSGAPHYRAINDERGRMMVLMTHNTDFGDSYERESENPRYFTRFSVPGYAFGINVLLYAMSH